MYRKQNGKLPLHVRGLTCKTSPPSSTCTQDAGQTVRGAKSYFSQRTTLLPYVIAMCRLLRLCDVAVRYSSNVVRSTKKDLAPCTQPWMGFVIRERPSTLLHKAVQLPQQKICRCMKGCILIRMNKSRIDNTLMSAMIGCVLYRASDVSAD